MPVTTQDTTAQLEWLSDRISTQVRWFAVGVLALVWGLLVTPPVTLKLPPQALLVVALLAVSVLFFDFLQYAVGYLSAHRLHREILETPGQSLAGFDRKDPWRRARFFFFWTKQVMAVLTFAGLIATVLPGLGLAR
jgi:hypothetical protein